MPQIAQNRTGETPQEREQRRESLLKYGHIFSEAHKRASTLRHRDESLEDQSEEATRRSKVRER